MQKTETLLRDALMSLISEKSYDSIVVKEILDRANVGRTTFYTHFRDKDELLASTIHQILRPAGPMQSGVPARPHEHIIRFSLPLFEYIQKHRDPHVGAHDFKMSEENRAVLHQHLQDVLKELINVDVEQFLRCQQKATTRVPSNVLANYLASTFVLMLNWWVEIDSPLTAKEVNELYRTLVLPTLITMTQT